MLFDCVQAYSKLLTNRINHEIASVISETQVGFIPSRKVVDNIIIAHELVKFYSRKHISPRYMIKVDIQNAYDSVDWNFLEWVISGIDFPTNGWVMQCVTIVTYSITINGELTRLFKTIRDLRQGDPISAFLFSLVMEYLSRNLNRLEVHKQFKYHPLRGKFKITHFSFVNDLLLFSRGDIVSVTLLHEKPSPLLYLQANLSKSVLYFIGVQMQRKLKFCCS